MRKILLSTLGIFLTFLGFGQMTDLIISEYGEGSSNNKYIEIYNGTGAAVNLSNYEIKLFTNGASTSTSNMTLSGTLANGATYVIANTAASTSITALADSTAGVANYNGDDAVVLYNNTVLIDKIGFIGVDPGTGWDVAGVTGGTLNHTLVRKASQCSPDTSWATSAGTTTANSQWIVYPQDTWTYIGSHTETCSGAPTCADPTSLSALIVNATAASISWNYNGAGMSNIEWGASGFTLGSGTLISGFTQGSGTLYLTNLTTGSPYQFYVQNDCGSLTSNWVGPITFTPTFGTPCADPTSLSALIVNATTASLSWNYNGAGMSNIEWGTSGFTLGSGTLISGFSQASGTLNLTNLTTGSPYQFYVQNDCGSSNSNWVGPVTFTTNAPAAIPSYSIGTVTTNDANGVPDSIGVYCKVQGIVTSADFDGNAGYNFTIQDQTGGIYIFRSSDIGNYQSVYGSEVRVVGTISQFNGLTQIQIDSITEINPVATLPSPTVVTNLTEANENMFLKVEKAYLADASQWPTNNTTKNIDIVTQSNDTIVMRVDFDTYIFDSLTITATDTITFTGVGGQFDSSNPYTSGYQIFPSFASEFTITPAIITSCNAPTSLGATPSSASASLSWTTGGSNRWNIEWGTQGFTLGSGTLIQNVNNNPYNLSGLTASTAYDFYVQDTCTTLNSTSPWSGPFTFTTTAAPTTSVYPIGTITTSDANGVADSLGVYCKVQGVVSSTDFDGNAGYNVIIQDGTGGIYLFRSSDIGTFQFTLGDEVRAIGTVAQFNGLTQLNIDSVVVISSGNSLPTPVDVTSLDETTENIRIRVVNAYLANPSQWPASTPSGSGVNVDIVTTTNDTLLMRIDSDTKIFDSLTVSATDTFNVIASGSQFDNSNPYTSGYQLLPSYHTDFTVKPAIITNCNAPTNVTVTPGAVDAVISWTTGGSNRWNIEWGAAGFSLGSGTLIQNVSNNPYTLNGLTASTSYDVYIQDSCSTLSSSSAWVGPINFTTTSIKVIPTYNIGTVTTDDVNGLSDSVGVYCKLIGVVFTPDYDGNAGYSFHIKDNTGGINVFNFADVGTYQSKMGDRVRVVGEILMYNGLTEIDIDSITVLSQNNPIGNPTIVTNLNGATESEFIKIENVKLVDPSMWPAPGFDANLEIVTPNNDTLVMRIDKDARIEDSLLTAPAGLFHVTGVGGQFDNSSPYTSGYQIFPRFVSDIEEVAIPCAAPTTLAVANVTETSADISWTPGNAGSTFNVVWGESGFTFSQGNVIKGLTVNSFTLTGLIKNTSYEFYVQDSCGGILGNSAFAGPASFFTDGDINVVESAKKETPLTIFPNPSNKGFVTLNKVSNVKVYNVLGTLVYEANKAYRINTAGFDSGVYFVKSDKGEVVRMIIK